MKKILSFDIGEITLTYCILLTENKSYNILDWQLCSIRTKCTNTVTEKIDNLLYLLKKSFPDTNDIDYILIEHQGAFRPFMKSIQMVIYTYFKLQGNDVRIKHAINKFNSEIISEHIKSSICLRKSRYQNNKSLSKAYVKSILPENYIKKYIINLDCMDDYADALFQGIDFIHKNFIKI